MVGEGNWTSDLRPFPVSHLSLVFFSRSGNERHGDLRSPLPKEVDEFAKRYSADDRFRDQWVRLSCVPERCQRPPLSDRRIGRCSGPSLLGSPPRSVLGQSFACYVDNTLLPNSETYMNLDTLWERDHLRSEGLHFSRFTVWLKSCHEKPR